MPDQAVRFYGMLTGRMVEWTDDESANYKVASLRRNRTVVPSEDSRAVRNGFLMLPGLVGYDCICAPFSQDHSPAPGGRLVDVRVWK